MTGECPKCHQTKKLTKHHVKPRRHFKKKRDRKEVLYLCRECHDELETFIPFHRQPDWFYEEVVSTFLCSPS